MADYAKEPYGKWYIDEWNRRGRPPRDPDWADRIERLLDDKTIAFLQSEGILEQWIIVAQEQAKDAHRIFVAQGIEPGEAKQQVFLEHFASLTGEAGDADSGAWSD